MPKNVYNFFFYCGTLSRAKRPAKRAFHYAGSDQSQTSPFLRPQTARHMHFLRVKRVPQARRGPESASVCPSVAGAPLWAFPHAHARFLGAKLALMGKQLLRAIPGEKQHGTVGFCRRKTSPQTNPRTLATFFRHRLVSGELSRI